MTTLQKNTSCRLGCGAFSAGVALLTTIACLLFEKMTITGEIFFGIFAFFVLGAMLSWLLCKHLPPLDGPVEGAGATETTRSSVKASPAAAEEAISALAVSRLKPSTPLAGEDELASRRGTWCYERSDTAAGCGAPVKAAPRKVAPKKAVMAAAVQENVGTDPEKLDGPSGGVAGHLKRIKGIRSKLEQLCHSLGFFHFHQFANWSDDEVAWVGANFDGFTGRMTWDQRAAQAKELAKG